MIYFWILTTHLFLNTIFTLKNKLMQINILHNMSQQPHQFTKNILILYLSQMHNLHLGQMFPLREADSDLAV